MVLTRQSSIFNNNGEGHSESGTFSKSKTLLVSLDPQQPSTSNALVVVRAGLNLLDLPQEILDKIFSYTGYKTAAHLRVVSRKMDSVCSNVLNGTFQRLQTQMLTRFQTIKSMMPRRESARRNHPLACESDIIETLHMRLTLLQMTFGKHIERKHCCFFAGEILDEVYRILNYIHITAPKLARPYKVTDELFDLSTMAMEYFKEYIEPTLPEIGYFRPDFFRCNFTGVKLEQLWQDSSNSFEESTTSSNGNLDRSDRIDLDYSQPEFPPQTNMVLRKRIRKIKQGMKRYNCQLSFLRRELRSCKSKMAEQQKQIVEYATRLDENDKKNDETSRKFSTLLQELNKCKTELQYWRSKSPANPILCNNCGKVLVPAPTEDLQILANQGVVPEINPENDQVGLLDLSLLPGTSSSQECSHMTAKKDQEVVACCSTSNLFSSTGSSSTPTVFSASPGKKQHEDFSTQTQNPEEEIKNKRKATDDPMPPPSDYKKVRRISKGRSKRAKL